MIFATDKGDVLAALAIFLNGSEENLGLAALDGTFRLAGRRRSVSIPVDIIEPGQLRALTGQVLRLRALARSTSGKNVLVSIGMKKRHPKAAPRLTFDVKRIPAAPGARSSAPEKNRSGNGSHIRKA